MYLEKDKAKAKGNILLQLFASNMCNEVMESIHSVQILKSVLCCGPGPQQERSPPACKNCNAVNICTGIYI